ncbi:hypothetical protein [Ureaplasma zalophigenitalium]|uniref:SGNH/GDSL hydrolase family protein n=1 Tax=Ureaplasma zalophigenitalium TaxID=907723 RepID=A0ABT3BPC8_9BACT|nr:hypothetical protein [Ureaplasma zalophigenitalium]MCV3754094.1 hypothetical protein [Ureaplasma zalophigenitalium]
MKSYKDQQKIRYVALGDSYTSGYDPSLGYELFGSFHDNDLQGLSYASFLVYFWHKYNACEVSEYHNLGLLHAKITDWLYLLNAPTDSYIQDQGYNYFAFLNEWMNIRKPLFDEHLKSYINGFYLYEQPAYQHVNDYQHTHLIKVISQADVLTISLGLFDFIDFELIKNIGLLIKTRNDKITAFDMLFDNLYLKKQKMIANYTQLIQIIQKYNPNAQIYLIGYLNPLGTLAQLVNEWTSFDEQDDLSLQLWDELMNVIKITAQNTNVHFINPLRSVFQKHLNLLQPVFYDLHPSYRGYLQMGFDLFVKTSTNPRFHQKIWTDPLTRRYLSSDYNCYQPLFTLDEQIERNILDTFPELNVFMFNNDLIDKYKTYLSTHKNQHSLLTHLYMCSLRRYKSRFIDLLENFFSLFMKDFYNNLLYVFFKAKQENNVLLGYSLMHQIVQSGLWADWMLMMQANFERKRKYSYLSEQLFWQNILQALFHAPHFNLFIEIVFKHPFIQKNADQWKHYFMLSLQHLKSNLQIIDFILYIFFNQKYNENIKQTYQNIIISILNNAAFQHYLNLFISQTFKYQKYILSQIDIYNKIITLFEVNQYLFRHKQVDELISRLITNDVWWSNIFNLLIFVLPDDLIRGLNPSPIIKYLTALKRLVINETNLSLFLAHIYDLLMHYDLIYLLYNRQFKKAWPIIKQTFQPYFFLVVQQMLKNFSTIKNDLEVGFCLFDNFLIYQASQRYKKAHINNDQKSLVRPMNHPALAEVIFRVLLQKDYDVQAIKDKISLFLDHIFLNINKTNKKHNILLTLFFKYINYHALKHSGLARNLLEVFKHLEIIFNDLLLLREAKSFCQEIILKTLFSNTYDPHIDPYTYVIDQMLENLINWVKRRFNYLQHLICDKTSLINTSLTGLIMRILKLFTANKIDFLLDAHRINVARFIDHMQQTSLWTEWLVYLFEHLGKYINQPVPLYKKELFKSVHELTLEFLGLQNHIDELIKWPFGSLQELINLVAKNFDLSLINHDFYYLKNTGQVLRNLMQIYQKVDSINSRRKITNGFNFLVQNIKSWRFFHWMIVIFLKDRFSLHSFKISDEQHYELIQFFSHNPKFLNLIKKFYHTVIIHDPTIYTIWLENKHNQFLKSLFYLLEKYDLTNDWKDIFFELINNDAIADLFVQFFFRELQIDLKYVNFDIQKHFLHQMITFMSSRFFINQWFNKATLKCMETQGNESLIYYLGVYLDEFKNHALSYLKNNIDIFLHALENQSISMHGLCDLLNTIIQYSPLKDRASINPLQTPWYAYLCEILLTPFAFSKKTFIPKKFKNHKYLKRFYQLLWAKYEQKDDASSVYGLCLKNITLIVFAIVHQKFFMKITHGIWHNKSKYFRITHFLIKTICHTEAQVTWISNFLKINDHPKVVQNHEKIIYKRLYLHLISLLTDQLDDNLFLFLELLKQKK